MNNNASLLVRWGLVVVGSVALGAGLSYLHVPATWILAAILASGAMALGTGKELPINEHFYRFARGIIGVLAAVPLVGVPLIDALRLLPYGIAVSLVTIGIGFVGGLLLARAQKDISPESGILGMLSGGASVMPAIASEIGGDMRFVALAQYLRLVAVSMTRPVVSGLMTMPNELGQEAAGALEDPAATQSPWWTILIVVAIALIGDPVGRRLHIPVPSVFVPLLLTVAVSLVLPEDVTLSPPMPLQVLAFMSIGWACGGALSVPALKAFAKNLPATIAFIIAVMAACALTAWPLVGLLDITYFEAYLATSPGALETVLALSAEGGAGHEVIALQLIRLVMVLLVAGWLPQLIRLITRRRG